MEQETGDPIELKEAPSKIRKFKNMKEAVQYYGEQGHTPEQISRFTGFDEGHVRATMKELSLIEGNLVTQAQTLKLVGLLLDESLTFEEIGRKFGITRQAVESVKRKGLEFGIPFPERSSSTGKRRLR